MENGANSIGWDKNTNLLIQNKKHKFDTKLDILELNKVKKEIKCEVKEEKEDYDALNEASMIPVIVKQEKLFPEEERNEISNSQEASSTVEQSSQLGSSFSKSESLSNQVMESASSPEGKPEDESTSSVDMSVGATDTICHDNIAISQTVNECSDIATGTVSVNSNPIIKTIDKYNVAQNDCEISVPSALDSTAQSIVESVSPMDHDIGSVVAGNSKKSIKDSAYPGNFDNASERDEENEATLYDISQKDEIDSNTQGDLEKPTSVKSGGDVAQTHESVVPTPIDKAIPEMTANSVEEDTSDDRNVAIDETTTENKKDNLFKLASDNKIENLQSANDRYHFMSTYPEFETFISAYTAHRTKHSLPFHESEIERFATECQTLISFSSTFSNFEALIDIIKKFSDTSATNIKKYLNGETCNQFSEDMQNYEDFIDIIRNYIEMTASDDEQPIHSG